MFIAMYCIAICNASLHGAAVHPTIKCSKPFTADLQEKGPVARLSGGCIRAAWYASSFHHHTLQMVTQIKVIRLFRALGLTFSCGGLQDSITVNGHREWKLWLQSDSLRISMAADVKII